jgi:hypothetical protein
LREREERDTGTNPPPTNNVPRLEESVRYCPKRSSVVREPSSDGIVNLDGRTHQSLFSDVQYSDRRADPLGEKPMTRVEREDVVAESEQFA